MTFRALSYVSNTILFCWNASDLWLLAQTQFREPHLKLELAHGHLSLFNFKRICIALGKQLYFLQLFLLAQLISLPQVCSSKAHTFISFICWKKYSPNALGRRKISPYRTIFVACKLSESIAPAANSRPATAFSRSCRSFRAVSMENNRSACRQISDRHIRYSTQYVSISVIRYHLVNTTLKEMAKWPSWIFELKQRFLRYTFYVSFQKHQHSSIHEIGRSPKEVRAVCRVHATDPFHITEYVLVVHPTQLIEKSPWCSS